MTKKKEIKRIFLYSEDTGMPESYEGAYKCVKAISDDEKHCFEFNVDQDNYGQSLKELCEKFEKFCVDECGFDSDEYCEVWTTFDLHSVLHIDGYRGNFYDDNLEGLLDGCDWAVFRSMESAYILDCSHLLQISSTYRRPPTFEEYVSVRGYNRANEPYASKQLFPVFYSEVMKRQFTEEELNNIVSFINDNLYLTYEKHADDFVFGIRHFLQYDLGYDLYSKDYLRVEEPVRDYVRSNRYTLQYAIIRLYRYDKKRLKKVRHNATKEELGFIKESIKWYKCYKECYD